MLIRINGQATMHERMKVMRKQTFTTPSLCPPGGVMRLLGESAGRYADPHNCCYVLRNHRVI